MPQFFWPAACRVAWRDLRSGRSHFTLAVLTLAAGVGTISATHGLSDAFATRLARDLRQWLAADIVVTLSHPPADEEADALSQLARDGVEETVTLETLGMASSAQTSDPVMVSVGVVDPRRYPFYGVVQLDPPHPLASALQPDSVILSRAAAERLTVRVGDLVVINETSFRVAARIASEPDRYAAAPNLFPRIMLSHDAFARGQIARAGNAVTWRSLLKVPVAIDVAALEYRLRRLLPAARIVSYSRGADPATAASLDAALTFLNLSAWMALVLGAAGVTSVVYLHIQRRLETIAILRALGGSNARIYAVYLLETAWIGAAGALLGALLARPIESLVLHLAGPYLPFTITTAWSWSNSVTAVGLGILAAFLAALAPLTAIRRVPPLQVMRRRLAVRPRSSRGAVLVSLAGLVAIALSMARSWKISIAFLGGLAIAIAILVALGSRLLAAVSVLARNAPRLPFAVRHGVINLGRPGNHASVCFLGMTAGLMMVASSWVGPDAVIDAIQSSLPLHGGPGLFLLDLQKDLADGVVAALALNPDLAAPVELLPAHVLRLAAIQGVPLDQLARRLPERWFSTCSPTSPPAAGAIVLSQAIAADLGVAPGNTLQFYSDTKSLPVRVAATRHLDALEEKRIGLLFSCNDFAGLHVTYLAGVYPRPGREDAVRKAIAARFPAVPVISREDLLDAFHSVAGDAASVLRTISIWIVASGAMIVGLLVAAGEKARATEIAIRQAVGAHPAQIRDMLLCEFATLGSLSGIAGGILGQAFAALLLSVVFRKAVLPWSWPVLVAVTSLGAAVSALSEWISLLPVTRTRVSVVLQAE